jgi:hypothetical protein
MVWMLNSLCCSVVSEDNDFHFLVEEIKVLSHISLLWMYYEV